ncbi:MAG: TolC family protein [Cytophagia bacterium]|nr:TolC family protein [Cytophagia bacterium]
MKRSIKRVSALLLMLLTVVSVKAQESFSLEEAIKYALEYNENVKIARVNTSDANSQVGETRADGLPQINANFGYTNNTQIPVNIVPANTFDPTAPDGATTAIRFGVQHQSSLGVSASQMLWDGSFFIGLKAARMLREKVLVDEQKAEQDVREQVMKAYYMVLVNQVRTGLIDINMATLDSTLRDTRAMYENGFAEKIDVSRLQVQLNNLKAEMSSVEQAILASKNMLKLTMGMPVDSEVELTDDLESFDFNYSSAEIDAFSISERVEVQQIEFLKRLAELDIKNTYSQYIPKVSLNAAWGRNSGTDIFGNLWNDQKQWFTSSNVGLSVSIPVFDGLRKKYTVERKRYQLETLNYQSSQLSNSLKQELVNAQKALDVNLEMLEVQEANLELAQEVADVTRAKYTEGVGSNLELIDADQAYKVAEINYLTALYDAIVAKIDLDKALGKLN